MKTRIQVDAEGSAAGLESIIDSANPYADSGCGLMLLACDANGFVPENVDPLLRKAKLPVFGGTFPAVICGRRVLTKGTVAVILPVVSESRFIPGFSVEDTRFDELIESTVGNAPVGKTMLVFVDGLGRRVNAFIEGLFNVFGLDINYVGGGAGSVSMLGKPCLFTKDGMRHDGAVLAFLPCRSGVGVCHGWKELSGPYHVTEADCNVIRTLNWRPALDVYAEALSSRFIEPVREENFFSIAKAHPFGISRLGTEQIVRDPLRVGDNGSIVCAGEVPEGSFVHLLYGNERSLIEAASTALERARAALPTWKQSDLHLFMDCISRVLFLGDRFQDELDAVCNDDVPFVGACTIGEIANSGADFLQFYNKTSVLAVLEGP